MRYYHPDERGSVRYITDAQGNVLESHLYKPYGQEYMTTGFAAFLQYPAAGASHPGSSY